MKRISWNRISHPLLLGIALFSSVLGMYLLSYSGRFMYVTDGFVMYNEALMLLDNGQIYMPAGRGRRLSSAEGGPIPYTKLGTDGRYYSKYGPGMAVVEALTLSLGRLLVPTDGRDPAAIQMLGLINPIVTAATAAVLFGITRQIERSNARAVFIAISYAFATFVWPYVSFDYSEPLQAFCVTCAVFAAFKWMGKERRLWLAAAGVLTGFAAATKPSLFIIAPWLLLYVLMRRSTTTHVKSVILFAFPVVVTALALGWYNQARFGSPFDTGFNPKESFSTPLITGLFGLTFSVNKGVIFFAPLTLLAPFGIARMQKGRLPEAVCLSGIFASSLLLYSMWWGWQGGLGWGPRFLVPVVGLLLPAAVPLLDRRVFQFAATGLALAGLFVNVLGVVVEEKTYQNAVTSAMDAAKMPTPAGGSVLLSADVPEFSQITGHLWLLRVLWPSDKSEVERQHAIEQPPWIDKYPQAVPSVEVDQILSPWILNQ